MDMGFREISNVEAKKCYNFKYINKFNTGEDKQWTGN
jgi:hypothetical protein